VSRRSQVFLLGLIAAVFLAGISWLYRLRLSGGDVFPPYSSLRADPLGTRAFYEALAEVPGIEVERWTRPLVALPTDPARTILLAGMTRRAWSEMTNEEAQRLDSLALTGSRILISFVADRKSELPSGPKFENEEERAERKKRKKDETKRRAELPVRLQLTDWEKLWGVTLKDRFIMDHDQGALRSLRAPEALPKQIPWKSDVYFNPAADQGWTVLYTRGISPVVIERLRGRGSIVLATDSYFLSNEALSEHREATLLAWIAGPNARVVFVESQLGLNEEVGIARLARRYGLAGCFFVFVLLAALWIWQRMALFVPPARAVEQLSLSYHQTAGLEALLRRAVPSKQLIQTCVAEWKAGARASDAAKIEAALAPLPADASPVDAYNRAVKALKRN